MEGLLWFSPYSQSLYQYWVHDQEPCHALGEISADMTRTLHMLHMTSLIGLGRNCNVLVGEPHT